VDGFWTNLEDVKAVLVGVALLITSRASATPLEELWLRSENHASHEAPIRHMSVNTPGGELDVTYRFATVSSVTSIAFDRELRAVGRGSWRISGSVELGKERETEQQSASVPGIDSMLAAVHVEPR
jgi:hypothetical protein